MTGQLFVVPRRASWRTRTSGSCSTFEDGRELWFRDIRKFGRVGRRAARRESTATSRASSAAAKGFKGFGPEPLDAAFTRAPLPAADPRPEGPPEAAPARPGRSSPGVGNIYADEALWAARLHPLRSAASLRPADEGRLYREIRRILAEAVERRGSSVDDYTAPDGDGSMQEHLQVYQRAGEPCFRCGRPVRRIVIGARSTHFCSWCQRLPAADKPGAAAILRGMEPRLGPARRCSRTGPRWTEIGGADGSARARAGPRSAADGALGTPTGSTRRAAERRAERARGATRVAARGAARRRGARSRRPRGGA